MANGPIVATSSPNLYTRLGLLDHPWLRRSLLIAAHAVLFPIAYFAAFGLRFDFQIPPARLDQFLGTVWYLIALRMFVFERFGLFRGYWRHAGMHDAAGLGAATTLSSLLFVTGLFFVGGLHGYPRSVLLLDWVLTIFMAGGVRFTARLLREGAIPMSAPPGKRTLIIGAGDAAEQLLRQLRHDGGTRMHVVGMVDDDPEKLGRELHGVRVMGSTDDLSRLVQRHHVQLLVIAVPSATGDEMQTLLERCRMTGVDFKILPPLQDLLTGRSPIAQLRDIQLEDLLGRSPVTLDLQHLRGDLAGRTILVTGAAGSIGSELVRQIATYGPKRLVLFERAESPLYFTHLEISAKHPDVQVLPVMGNVTNGYRLDEVMREHQPDYVFHAAAYKHVPMLEANVSEGLWNNIVGTLRVAESSARHGVKKFVLISTDKAVNPSSILGATKRIAERIVLELPQLRSSTTDFRVVRFGNVLGSDGSVIPLFKRQMSAGGPLTVTHPDVKRYFMTIPESVQLVLTAAALPEAASRISILEMGTQMRIVDLAVQLIRLSGLIPYQDVQIVFTGLRPGEKLQEELVAVGEATVPTSVEKIRIVERGGTDGALLDEDLNLLLAAMTRGDVDAAIHHVTQLVTEYRRAEIMPPLPLEPLEPAPAAMPPAARATARSMKVANKAAQA